MDAASIILLAAVVLVGVALPRWAAIGFLAAGSTVFYGALHYLGGATSAALAGGVAVIAGGLGILRLSRHCRASHWSRVGPAVIAFGLFLAFWFLRWVQEPPRSVEYGAFTDRIFILALAFAIAPFVAGLCARGEHDLESLLKWLAAFGAGGSIVVMVYWVTGQPSLGGHGTLLWLPIPYLNGISLAFDLGIGCVAYYAYTAGRPSRTASIGRILYLAVVIAIGVRVGERGPVLFLLPSLGATFLLRAQKQVLRRSLGAGISIVMVISIASHTSTAFEATRTVDQDSYSTESNANRVALVLAAGAFVLERPVIGWGGGLVGARIGTAGTWQYSHVWLLDGLLETGMIGGLLQLSVLALALRGVYFAWRSRHSAATMLLPVLLYVFLEAQVSGHISASKQLWLVLGVCCSMVGWGSLRRRGEPGTRDRIAEAEVISPALN